MSADQYAGMRGIGNGSAGAWNAPSLVLTAGSIEITLITP